MAAAADRPRAVVPARVNRSLWLTAVWTGAGAAFVAAVAAIVAVAVCWLPASGTAGNADSAIHAGLLTFLAGLHGGITVDGTATSFVPLGLTMVLAAVAWRAGCALGDAADEHGERDAVRLLAAGGAQLASFTLACGITAAFATLGTTSVAPISGALGAALLWLLTGSLGFARSSELWTEYARRRPNLLPAALRLGAACLAVYLAAGALVTAVSLAAHYGAVSELSRQAGGGWSGLPVLLLGMLAVPNAALAGAGYLAGPGFAVGAHTTVRLWSTAHGTVPAFPLLGALPSSPAGPFVWLIAAATPLTAGSCVALLARRAARTRQRWRDAALGTAAGAIFGAVAAALTGGGIGDARLATVGVSPWQFAVAVAGGSGAVTAVVLGGLTGLAALRSRRPDRGAFAVLSRAGQPASAATAAAQPDCAAANRGESADELAG